MFIVLNPSLPRTLSLSEPVLAFKSPMTSSTSVSYLILQWQRSPQPLSVSNIWVNQHETAGTGEEYPYQTLELNPADIQKGLQGYFRFLQGSEVWRNLCTTLYGNLRNGGGTSFCTLFMFNNVANGSAHEALLNPHQNGDLQMNFWLGVPIGQVINMVLYAEFENVLEIYGHNAVMINVYQGV